MDDFLGNRIFLGVSTICNLIFINYKREINVSLGWGNLMDATLSQATKFNINKSEVAVTPEMMS